MTKTQKRLIKLKGGTSLRAFSAKVGIGQSTMHNYLHGRKLREDVIRKFCRAYGVTSDWLLGISENVDPQYLISNVLNDMKIRHAEMAVSLANIEDYLRGEK